MKHFLLTFFATLLAASAFAQGETKVYEENFSSSNHGFTFPTNSAKSWSYQSYNGRLQFYQSNYTTADAWAISPSIPLESGKAYKLSFSSWRQSGTSYKDKYLTVNLSNESTIEAIKSDGVQLLDLTVTSDSPSNSEETLFSVNESGDYHLAFQAYGEITDLGDQYLDNILVVEIEVVPSAPLNLSVVPSAGGQAKVDISWTNPINYNSGSPIEGLTKVELYRNETLIATLTSEINPGEESSYTDNFEDTEFSAGNYTYYVVAYANEKAGNSSDKVTAWVGADIPAHITNLELSADEDNPSSVSINFTVPVGENNGFVDFSNLYYKIERTVGNNTTIIEPHWQGSLPYVDSSLPGLNYYTYSIYNVDSNGDLLPTKDNKQSAGIVAGGEFNLPYSNTFDTAEDILIFNNFSNISAAGQKFSVSSNALSANKYAYSAIDAWLVSPKVSLQAGKVYNISFKTWKTGSGSSNIHFYVATGNDVETLKTNQIFSFTPSATTAATAQAKDYIFSVAENGTYYFAIQVEGTSNSAQVNVFIDDLEIELLPTTPMAPENVNAVANELGQNKITLSWFNPSLGNNGLPLSSIEKIEIYRNDKPEVLTTLSGNNYSEPGAECSWEDNDIEEAGFYTYTIKPYLDGNTKDFAEITSNWVGIDELTSVSNVIASISTENPKDIVLTFDSKGKNGGFVDLSDVTYKITRKTKSNSTETTLTENFKYENLPFVDDNTVGLNGYTYKVYVNNISSDKGTESNNLIGGGTVELPYYNDFASTSNIDLFTKGHAEGQAKDWMQSSGALAYTRSGQSYTEHDAWIITPPIYFLKDANYKVSFDAYGANAYYYKPLEVYVTTSLDSKDWTSPIVDETNVGGTSASPTKFSRELIAQESGVYYVVFRLHGTVTDNNYFYIDNLLVERSDRAPLAVEDLTAVAGSEGAMTATISWTNPTLDNKGDNLEKIDKIVVLRDDREIGTVTDNLIPGEAGSYEDALPEGATAGNYSYTVVAYLEDVPGVKADAVIVWIGPDELKAPENVSISLNIDGYPQIAFDAVTEGIHGGYVDADAVRYNVYRGNDKIASELSEPLYVDNSDQLVSGTTYSYSVSAVIGETESAKSGAVSIKYVAISELPLSYDLSIKEVAETWDIANGWGYRSYNPMCLETGNYADRWTNSTPFKANKGVVKVIASVAAESSSKPQNVEFYLVTDASSKINKIYPAETQISGLTNTNFDDYTYTFDVPTDGVYYLAVYSTSPGANNYYTRMNRVEIQQEKVADPNTPNNPTNVAFSVQEDGSRLVTFDAVTETISGEPIENVTYNIFRNGELLKDGIEENRYVDSDNLELGKHYYGVQAVNGELVSSIVSTDTAILGDALSLPYKPDFSKADDFEYWTFINPEGNGNWKYGSSNISNYPAISSSSIGALAITPPFRAEKGTCAITYAANSFSSLWDDAEIEIYLLKDINNLNDKQLLHEKAVGFSSFVADKEETVEFTIEFAGTYYICLRHKEDSMGLYVYKADIEQIEVATEPAEPKAPASVVATIEEDGSVVVTFDAVTADINDTAIEGVTYDVYRNGDKLTSEAISTTTFTDNNLEGLEFAKYVYTVKALWDEFESEPAAADALFFGEALNMNYNRDIEDDNELWSVIAPEGSDATWTYVNDGEDDPYFFTTAKDAVLVTPPLHLEAYQTKLELYAAAGHETETESLNLHIIVEKLIENADEEEVETQDDKNALKVRRKVSSEDLSSSQIHSFELSATSERYNHVYDIPNECVGRIGFSATTAEGSNGVKLYSISVERTDLPTGIKGFTTGVLVYDRTIQTILVPTEGILEIFNTAGMRVVRALTNEDLNISSLGAGSYVARFTDLNGNVSIVKFVK